MWWIEPGDFPGLMEAAQRLNMIQQNGPSPEAFNFAHGFDATGQPLR